MSKALGLLLTNLFSGERLSTPRTDGCALAAAVREWVRPRRQLPATPPIGCLLQTHPELAERLARGLESDRPGLAAALVATERLLGDAQPRLDDLRRVVYLVEAA